MRLQKNQNVIPAMVRRHVEDTAFYWSQNDVSDRSPRLHLSDLNRFNATLQAHLDGIEVAGVGAWPIAMAMLERWKKPGEAFACAYVAFTTGEAAELEALVAKVQARPDELLRGVISALAWVPNHIARNVIERWTEHDSRPVTVVAALRAFSLISSQITSSVSSANGDTWIRMPLHEFLTSSDAHVRAAACRVAANYDDDEQIKERLKDALKDPDFSVRARASIAVARLAKRGAYRSRPSEHINEDLTIQSAETLWQCIVSQVAVLNQATGWYANQAKRRLNRWVEHLAWMVTSGSSHVSEILRVMPARTALRFVAYHGDTDHLGFVTKQMADPRTARYAGWVWQVITGVDLVASGLVIEEPSSADSALKAVQIDDDFGLPLPNSTVVSDYRITHCPGQRCLNGHVVTLRSMLEIMESGSQAVRSIASQHLQSLDPDFFVSVRAPAVIQIKTIDQLQELMHLEGLHEPTA
ncbi:HEAT repeat domain-containing protein [Massilia violaceinigra]|nr:HEAT repeat domain-containing protein [Massilia violaceinigra]